MRLICQYLLPIAIFALLSANSSAQDTRQPLDDIMQLVEQHFATMIEKDRKQGFETKITLGKLDRRLRLAPCANQMESFAPNRRQSEFRMTVGVRCTGAKPWTVYVPVVIDKWANVIVAAHPLARGTKVDAADFSLKKEKISRLRRGYFAEATPLIGKITKRNLRSGQIIKASHLADPKLVQKGEKVIISAATAGININMYGEALKDGAKGELIKVRNLSSRQTIQAEVIRAGVVEVRL